MDLSTAVTRIVAKGATPTDVENVQRPARLFIMPKRPRRTGPLIAKPQAQQWPRPLIEELAQENLILNEEVRQLRAAVSMYREVVRLRCGLGAGCVVGRDGPMDNTDSYD